MPTTPLLDSSSVSGLYLNSLLSLYSIQIRQLVHFLRRFSLSTLASVAREELAAVAELVYSHQAVVLTALPHLTWLMVTLKVAISSGVMTDDSVSLHVIFSGYQRRSVSAHQPRDIRPYYRPFPSTFSMALQNSVIEEGSALYHDLVSRLFRIPQL